MNLHSYLPQLIAAGGGLVIILVDLVPPGAAAGTTASRRLGYFRLLTGLAGATAMAAGLAALAGIGREEAYTVFFQGLFSAVALLVALLAPPYLERLRLPAAEFYALTLFSAAGMMTVAGAPNLLTLYLGLELLSQSSYALSGLATQDPRSVEASLKYFLVGSLASTVALFGIALLYGAAGTFDLAALAAWARGTVGGELGLPEWSGVAGVVLFLVGLGLKVAAVPFHMWAPDAYEGAPTPVTALFSVGPKAAGLAALVRVMTVVFPGLRADWSPMFAAIAVATMTLGNLAALNQTNIKRMMAYSSIAQAGYLLVALVIPGAATQRAFLYYLVAYAAANLGAFSVITWWGSTHPEHRVSDFRRMGTLAPLPAAALTFFFLSLVGIPPTAGFFGKFLLFSAAVRNGQEWLALVILFNGVLSVPYYYEVIREMYFPLAGEPAAPPRRVSGQPLGFTTALVLGGAILVVAGLGLYPERFLELTVLATLR
ncbi:MAG TPA: NADH-quinone oxidoreductase subunit N [Firmicutes bacterium]|nr:NADH-quinone oxidoreductase subunit N [Bacillota bacterium]